MSDKSIPDRIAELERQVAAILKILTDMSTTARFGCCTDDLERSLKEILKKDLPG